MPREQPIVRATIEAVNATFRAFVWRNQSGTARGGKTKLAPKGSPDIVGFSLVDGRFIGLELKAPGARTERKRAIMQAQWRKLIEGAGGIAAVVTSPAEAVALVMGGRR